MLTVLAMVAAAVLLATWALGIGRYGGPDEPAHVTRAAAVGAGEWRGTPNPAFAPGYRVVTVPAALATGDPSCYRHDPTLPATCAAGRDVPGTVQVASSAGINPPWYYALVGVPVRWFGDPADTTWYRAVAVVWNLLVLALIGWRLRPFAARAVLVAAFVTPAAWFMFGVVNPNGIEILLALLAWVGVARLLTSPAGAARAADIPAWLWVSAPLAVAIAMRPVAVFGAAAVAVVLVVAGRLPQRRELVPAIGPLAAAAISVLAWNVTVAAQFDDPRTAEPIGTFEAFGRALAGTPDTLTEMVSSLGWLEYSTGPLIEVAWLVVAAVVVLMVQRTGRGQRRSLVALAAVLLGTPVAFEVLVHHRLGFIWQGRYSIPALLGAGAIAVASPWRPQRRTIVGAAAIAAAIEVSTFLLVLHRSTVGTDGTWSMTGPGAWSPALAPWILVAVHVVAVVALAVLALTTSSTPHPSAAPNPAAPTAS